MILGKDKKGWVYLAPEWHPKARAVRLLHELLQKTGDVSTVALKAPRHKINHCMENPLDAIFEWGEKAIFELYFSWSATWMKERLKKKALTLTDLFPLKHVWLTTD